MKKKARISTVIPNWNGNELLKRNLPSLIEAMDYYGGEYEIIVVDDGSTDDSVRFLKDTYPQIKVIELIENKGFSAAVNAGVKASNNQILYILNSDVKVSRDFLEPLLAHFKDENVFAVSSRAIAQDGKTILSGRCGVKFKWGMVMIIREKGAETPSFTFRASGGHSAFDRKKFLELGCFDELYAPFYSEDEDICYRAWKRGWKVIYEPRSTVFHIHQSTIGKSFSRGYIEMMFRRNKLLFIWKNITDRFFLLQHILSIPVYLIFGLFLRPYWTISFFPALGRISRAIRNKKNEKKFFKLKDREVIKIIQGGSD